VGGGPGSYPPDPGSSLMSHPVTFPGFQLRLTRWGAIFLLAVLVLGFAAVNTGNNALMGLLGLALASYVVSGLWFAAGPRGRRGPRHRPPA